MPKVSTKLVRPDALVTSVDTVAESSPNVVDGENLEAPKAGIANKMFAGFTGMLDMARRAPIPSVPSVAGGTVPDREVEFSLFPLGIGWNGCEVGVVKLGAPADAKGVKVGWTAVALNGDPIDPVTFHEELDRVKAAAAPFSITFQEVVSHVTSGVTVG